MTLTCVDCGWTGELPEDFFDRATDVWKGHGHTPGHIIYTCVCGETHHSGPLMVPKEMWPVAKLHDLSFYTVHHTLCEGASNEPQQVGADEPYRYP